MTEEAEGSKAVDAKIASLPDWRGKLLSRIRALIKDTVPGVEEDAKWRKSANPLGVPTWSHGGMICTGETYKDKVKLTFARGASLNDPKKLFNSSLNGGTRRAIDIHEGEELDMMPLEDLIREAVAVNLAAKK